MRKRVAVCIAIAVVLTAAAITPHFETKAPAAQAGYAFAQWMKGNEYQKVWAGALGCGAGAAAGSWAGAKVGAYIGAAGGGPAGMIVGGALGAL